MSTQKLEQLNHQLVNLEKEKVEKAEIVNCKINSDERFRG